MLLFQFEDIFMELKENFEDLLAFNHLRVITSLAKVSCKFQTCQMKLVKVRYVCGCSVIEFDGQCLQD